MAKVSDVVESIEETKETIKETGAEVSTNINELKTVLDVYEPLVEKLISWIGYGLGLIGLLLLVNLILIGYLVIKHIKK